MNEPGSNPGKGIGSFLTPGSFIAAARRADPNFKYAIVAAGLLAIVVIFAKFGVSYAALLFGAIALIGLMVLFLVFAQILKLRHSALDLPARVLVWTIMLVVVAIVLLLTTSAFFNWPLPFRDSIVRSLTAVPDAARKADTGTSDQTNTTTVQDIPAKPPVETATGDTTPVDSATRALIVQDVTDAYKQAGWQIAFINNWGQPPTRENLRVENKQLVGTAPDGRVVKTSLDPDALPAPQYYNAQTIGRIGSSAAPKVAAFYTTYGQYKAALGRLNAGPTDFLAEFTTTTVTGNELMRRGREALCAMGSVPPTLFPGGGFAEPQPPNCDGLAI